MVDIAELTKSEFWKKKFRRAVETRDADKNGVITRSDFDLVVERYKQSAGGTTEKIETMSKMMNTFCDRLGLVDDSVAFSYEEFEQRWLEIIDEESFLAPFRGLFKCLDANGDNGIDMNEWKIHNVAMGIPPEHAQDSFNAIDVNKDGVISEEEFLNYHYEFFRSTENKLNSAILYGPL